MDFFTMEAMPLFGLVRYHVLFVIDIAKATKTRWHGELKANYGNFRESSEHANSIKDRFSPF